MKIIVDAFGGDNAPLEMIKGARQAADEYGVQILLSGDREQIESCAKQNSIDLTGMEILDAEGMIPVEADPTTLLKDYENCSMAVGMRALKDGQGDAFVSAGSTGAMVVGASLVVKRLKGVRRTAIPTIIPNEKGCFMLIDSGANAECSSDMLTQFGMMGSVYMNKILGVDSPRVGLVNIGTEETKGLDLHRETYGKLQAAPLNFVGNVEARSLPLYPDFEAQEDGTLRSIVHYKDYEPMFEHYGVPPYIAGFSVSAIAWKTDRWNISRLDNSFQLSGVMMLDSSVDNEAEAERIVRLAEQKFAGNPGQVMFVIRDGGEDDNSRFIPIAAQNEGDWQALHEQAVGDIVVAHSWFRTLSGLDYAAGFSAERILHEYEVALNTVILAEQDELTEPIRAVIASVLGLDTTSLQIVNRPPTRSKPIYMKVWEARKADGLDYDPEDERQQAFLSEITKYNIRSIE